MDDALSPARSTEVERLILEWLEARERGDAADAEQLLRGRPDLADALRERLQAIELVGAALDAPDLATPPSGIEPLRMDPHGAVPGGDSPHVSDSTAVGAGPEAAPPRSIGEFRILRELGRGAMGVVYEAEQNSMRRRVALKVLFPAVTSSPKAVLRFQREARAAGRLHHTNVVPVYGMGEERGVWWYAMELVHGRPLDAVIEDVRRVHGNQRVRQEGAPKSSAFGSDPGTRAHYERVASTFAGVAEGLDFGHQAGVVHRDVKPSNLVLDADGRLRLTDFGLARVADEGVSMTLSGDVVGTPAYMSPEQARAAPDVDARTDVYSLGATLYEVLTLRAPFQDAAPGEIFSRIVKTDPPPPRSIDARIPRDLATIVEKAMEKERARRYAGAGEMARDLRLYAEGAAIRAKRIGPLGRAWRTARRHKTLTSLAATVAVLAVGGAVAANRALRAEAANDEIQYAARCMWLRDELVVWRQQLDSGDAELRGSAQRMLEWVQRDRAGEFAGISDEAELAKLPEQERAAWREFWVHVAALLARSRAAPAAPLKLAPPEFDWGPPVNLGDAVNTAEWDELQPQLSWDGLSLYFVSDRPGFGDRDLWVAERQSEVAPWGAPVNLGRNVNSAFREESPAMSPDGLSLYFNSGRPAGHGDDSDLYVARRTHAHDDWGTPVNLGEAVNSTSDEFGPTIFVDEERGRTELYFAVLRKSDGLRDFDFQLSLLGADGRFGPPMDVVALNTPSNDFSASIRYDGREMILTSGRPGGVNTRPGKADLWVSTRETTSGPWKTPQNLGGTVNSTEFDGGPTFSGDGKTLIFFSDRDGGRGGFDLWMTTRR